IKPSRDVVEGDCSDVSDVCPGDVRTEEQLQDLSEKKFSGSIVFPRRTSVSLSKKEDDNMRRRSKLPTTGREHHLRILRIS
ncbi:hypothetical protein A2U01_0040082, partial [Trifolium medium]|nr:hypothetical protein [Trifolium medium]